MLGWLVEYEASFKLDKSLEVEKWSTLLMRKVDGLVQRIVHMLQNVGRHYDFEMVIATSSVLVQVLLKNN